MPIYGAGTQIAPARDRTIDRLLIDAWSSPPSRDVVSHADTRCASCVSEAPGV